MASRRCAPAPGSCPTLSRPGPSPQPRPCACPLRMRKSAQGTRLKLADWGSALALQHTHSALHLTRGQQALCKGPGSTSGFAGHTVSVPTAWLCQATIQTSTCGWGPGKLGPQLPALVCGRLYHAVAPGCAPAGSCPLGSLPTGLPVKVPVTEELLVFVAWKERVGPPEACRPSVGRHHPSRRGDSPAGSELPADSVPPPPEWRLQQADPRPVPGAPEPRSEQCAQPLRRPTAPAVGEQPGAAV